MQQCIIVAALLFWFALSGIISHVYTAQDPWQPTTEPDA